MKCCFVTSILGARVDAEAFKQVFSEEKFNFGVLKYNQVYILNIF
ncbi:hypothetical protein [Clostridium beijerinckii]|nr:hypothetical protein [Clostridium beijerinckii]